MFLDGLLCNNPDDELTVIDGGARGADHIAWEWSTKDSCDGLFTHETYPADWERYGKSAGYIRNQQMLDEGKPDLVVAFVDKPLAESKGTKNMVHLARLAGVKTVVVECLP